MAYAAARLPLKEGFAYVHEPLVGPHGSVPFMGDDEVVTGLADRILHSSGGCFLVTGFRGVGKTTAVLRTLGEIESSSAGAEVVPIVLNVARPISTGQLLFEVVRRLFEALVDRGILSRLPHDTQRALVLAYTRTSLAFKETRSNSRERGASLDLGAGAAGGPVGAVLRLLGPKVSFSRRKTDALAAEAAFLAYTDTDVEHDFLRIVGLLQQARTHRAARGVRLVVIVDELDKLTATPEGLASMEALLASLKNLLTTRGIHFVFVGGPDLHDLSLLDAQRGNSVYESVFSAQFYVPCVWGATSQLVAHALDDDASHDELDDLCGYLDFKARGIPRLLLREFNSLVRWEDGRAHLALGPLDRDRVEFYGHLQSVLAEFMARPESDQLFALPIDEDRWRLGTYYVADWILRRRKEFAVDDILAAGDAANFDPTLRMAHEKVTALTECLAEHGVLERVWSADASHTLIGDAAQATVYRLADDVRGSLKGFARGNARERADLAAVSGAVRSPWVETDEHEVIGDGRYELGELIGRGGMGAVYRGTDRRLHRDVAVKVLEGAALSDHSLRARFEREAELTVSLRHPNIVRTHEIVRHERRLAIVMEHVVGVRLRERISAGPMYPTDAVGIAVGLLDALDYLWSHGIARCDLKPENVVLRDGFAPVMIDFGLVRRMGVAQGRLTATGTALGTPLYMSPEQAMAVPDLDIRSDLYCLGLVLAEMLAGRHPRADDSDQEPMAIMLRAVNEDVDVSDLEVSAPLRFELSRALARDRDERHSTPAEMRQALERVPEAPQGPPPPPAPPAAAAPPVPAPPPLPSTAFDTLVPPAASPAQIDDPE